MADLRLDEAAAAMGGRLVRGDGPARPSGASIDSRTLRRGDLFFALQGPNHDGHRFAADASNAGAAAVVVSREIAVSGAAAVIRVSDTTRALQDLAAHLRRREAIKVVGITGSAGKTTAKEMTWMVLAGPFRAYRSEGNLNNLYGLPLALLRMPPDTQVAVLEMGMSYPGEIARLVEIASPEVGVLLNIGRAHQANFASPQEIARAKGELFDGMGAHGTGIFNEDDELVRQIADRFDGFRFTFGIERPADLVAEEIVPQGFSGTRLRIRHGRRSWPVRLDLVGTHQVYNLLAALSVGYMLGCDLPGMLERAAAIRPLPGRGERIELRDGIRLIDDSYNSNPAALRRAIGALRSAAPAGSRTILVTGDMLELGDYGPEAHREAGAHVAEAALDVVVAVGELSAATAEAARERGVKEVLHFAGSQEAADAVRSMVRPGDTLLVKGSRGMRMERVVQALREKA